MLIINTSYKKLENMTQIQFILCLLSRKNLSTVFLEAGWGEEITVSFATQILADHSIAFLLTSCFLSLPC